MEMSMDPTTFAGMAVCLLMWLAGVISNAGRTMHKQGLGFVEYWKTDWTYSVAATFVSIAGAIYLLSTHETSAFMYFSVGYIADSFINRAESAADSGTLDLPNKETKQ